MLGLQLPTDPRWAQLAHQSLQEILTDHAYCEQKAASAGISLIVSYPEKEKLIDVCRQVVAEEWDHFNQVIEHMRKRGYALGPQRKDLYVNRLQQYRRKGGTPQEQLLDRLLISAMIEARSCERFKKLNEEVSDPELKQFYHELMVSEANHYTTFLDLAKTYLPEDQVRQRLTEFVEEEGRIIRQMELRGDRMH